MKNYSRILTKFFCEEWGIRPDKHAAMGTLLRSRMHGTPGLAPAAFWDDDEEEPAPKVPQIQIGSGLAIIPIHGVIGKHLDLMESMCGGVDLALVDEMLDEVAADDSIRTVILDINSPGGITTGMLETTSRIAALTAQKTTIAFSDTEANSCGYWLASQCGEIYCAPSAQLGCIGTFIAAVDESGAWAMEGYKRELFTSGPYKGMGVAGNPFSDQQKAYLQGIVDRGTEVFKGAVRAARPGIDESSMDGQWFKGSDAKGFDAVSLGLADGLANSLQDVVNAALAASLL